MIGKEDVMCVEKTCAGPFWEGFLVSLGTGHQNELQSLRVMKKKKIIEFAEEDMVWHEFQVRSQIRHPFLVNVVCGFQDYEHLFLLTEQSQNCLVDLVTSEQRLSTKAARFYIAEILLAIQYLHSKELSYGFLSPSNMMIGDDGHVKLKYDFLNGIDVAVGGLENNVEYASIDEVGDWSRAFVSDYWSVGVVLYQMIAGTTPFAASTAGKTVCRIRECRVVFPDFFDADARDLVERLLVVCAEERLGARREDAVEIRKHAFFRSIDWDALEGKRIEPPFLFNTTRKDSPSRPASLHVLYTTDYLPDQKDGYGQTFRSYGSAYSHDRYMQMWRCGIV